MFGLRLFEESFITSSCSIQLQSYKFYLFFAIFFNLFSFLCAKSRIHGKFCEKTTAATPTRPLCVTAGCCVQTSIFRPRAFQKSLGRVTFSSVTHPLKSGAICATP